jgi:hypothetical protein
MQNVRWLAVRKLNQFLIDLFGIKTERKFSSQVSGIYNSIENIVNKLIHSLRKN